MRVLLLLPLALPCASCQLSPPPLPPASEVAAAAPRTDNAGKYVSPFSKYGTVAEWVSRVKQAQVFGDVAAPVGQHAGAALLDQIPLFGSLAGQSVGRAIAKDAVLNAAGGWDFIRESSDLSLDRPGDLCAFLYAKHSDHPDYAVARNAAFELYPEVEAAYDSSIRAAHRPLAASQGAAQ